MRLMIWPVVGLLLATPALCETQTIACPVGGAEVEILPTYDCTRTGWTMSLRQTTDCDELSRLPVCPTSGLPLFTRYTPSEVDALRDYVTTQGYALRRDRSDWLRAVDVANFLDSWGSQDSFLLMLNILWWEPDALLADDSLVSRFVSEAKAEIIRQAGTGETQVFTQAVLGFVMMLSGQPDAAKPVLASAQKAPEASDQMQVYLAQLVACADQIDSAACRPDAPFATK